MQVLDDEHDGPELRAAQGECAQGREGQTPAVRRVHGGDGCVARVDGEQVPDERHVRLEVSHAAHHRLDLGDDLRLAVELLDAEVLA